jgi:hypothetical protein
MFSANSNMKQMKGKLPSDMPPGLMLEMTGVNDRTGDKVLMRVTEINANANVAYVMSEYPRMGAGQKP